MDAIQTLDGHFSPDGNALAVTDVAGQLHIYGLGGRDNLRCGFLVAADLRLAQSNAHFSPGSNTLAVTDIPGQLHFYGLGGRDGRVLPMLTSHRSDVTHCNLGHQSLPSAVGFPFRSFEMSTQNEAHTCVRIGILAELAKRRIINRRVLRFKTGGRRTTSSTCQSWTACGRRLRPYRMTPRRRCQCAPPRAISPSFLPSILLRPVLPSFCVDMSTPD